VKHGKNSSDVSKNRGGENRSREG